MGHKFELAADGVEPLLVRKGEALEFDAVVVGSVNCSSVNQERDLLFRDV